MLSLLHQTGDALKASQARVELTLCCTEQSKWGGLLTPPLQSWNE